MIAAPFVPPPREPSPKSRAPAMVLGLAFLGLVAASPAAPALAEEADPVRPMTVIDRTDIEMSGLTSVSELLFRRLSVNGFGLHRPFVLGTGRAAVLINGRHISDTTLELSTLPLSAVERVEVLSGGAPALHGEHAIAGAVNIVLRRDYEGVEATAFAGRPTDVGGDAEQGSALWGGMVGDGHVTIGVDVYRSEEIPDAAREHSRAKWTPDGTFADATGVSVGGNTVFITLDNDTPNDRSDDSTIARPLGDCPADTYTGVLIHSLGTGCGFPYANVSWSTARYERESLFLTVDQPLNGSTDAYLDARIATDELLERYAPSVGTFSVEATALADHLPTTGEVGTYRDTVRVAHRFLGHGNREWLTTLDEYDVTLGLAGEVTDGIGYDTHLRYYRHDSAVDGNTFVSESAIQQIIQDGRYDVVNPLSPDNQEAIHESSLRLTRERVTERRTVRATLDGPMAALGGGEARWAAGVEVAAEEWKDVHAYRDRSGRSYEAKDILGAGGIQGEGKRQSWSGFAEVSLPVRADWDVELVGRGTDHDDVDATYSFEVASSYRVNDELTLRGAWDRSSKPPSLRDLHFSSNDFPWVCDRTSYSGPLDDCPVRQEERVSSGDPNLEPDEAESFSLGASMDLEPLFLSADWFQITLADVPTQLSAQLIMDLEVERALPPGVAVMREGDTITLIESPVVNSGESDVSGVDMQARLGWETGWADMVLDTRWLHVSKHEARAAGRRLPGDHPRDAFTVASGEPRQPDCGLGCPRGFRVLEPARDRPLQGPGYSRHRGAMERPARTGRNGPHRRRSQCRGPRPQHRSHGSRCRVRDSGHGPGRTVFVRTTMSW